MIADNPLWLREVRARMRGAKAYLLLLAYAVLLTLICAFVYLQWLDDHTRSGQRFSTQAGFVAGQLLYRVLFTTQAVLIAIITPALTAGAITLEREQRTLEMVALTRLKPSEVVLGKLGSAVAFVALLLTSSLPLVSLAFFLGGVSPAELFFTYLTLLFAALFFGAVGIYCSALVPSTSAATVLAFGGVGIFFFVSLLPVPGGMGGPGAGVLPFRSLNPIGAVMNATSTEAFFRWSLPSWLPAVLFLGLAAFLIANLAMARLEFYRDARTVPIQLLATALWGLAFLHLVASTLGSPGFQSADAGAVAGSLTRLAGLDLALLLLLVPSLSVRDAERGSDRWATPTLFLWLLLPFLYMLAGVALMNPAQMPAVVATLVPALLLALAMTAAFIALAQALSAWLPSRGPAVGLVYTLVAAALLLPYLTLINWQNALEPGRSRFAWELLYLTPFTGLSELADPVGFRRSMPPTLAGDLPFWQVTSGIYLLLAALLAVAALARRGRVKPVAAG